MNIPRGVAARPELCHYRSLLVSVLMRILRRLHYWWSLFVAAALLLIFGPPVLLVAWLTGKHDLVYPWALFGARNWLRLSGAKVQAGGSEHLNPEQTYV